MDATEAKVPFTESRASVALDAIRGVAALLVTLEHLRYRLFFVFTPEDLRRPWFYGLLIISQLGHFAVIAFFVLSGFLVGGSLLRADQSNRWSWRNYLTHRFVRLWIVLVPALLIGCIWDLCTIHLGQHGNHTPEVGARIAETARCLTVRGFLGNIAFLQNVLVPVFGSNGPLWSLVNEFWYYILFPLTYFAIKPRYSPALRVTLLVVAILLSFGLRSVVLLYAPLWLGGAMLYYFPQLTWKESTRRVALGIFAVAALSLVKLSFRLPILADYMLAVVIIFAIWVVLSAREAADNTSLRTRLFRLLARFSYTLYLVHVPIFTFVGVYLIRRSWRPTLPHLLFAGVVWMLTLLFAWAIASLTEFRTEQVRRYVENATEHTLRTWRSTFPKHTWSARSREV